MLATSTKLMDSPSTTKYRRTGEFPPCEYSLVMMVSVALIERCLMKHNFNICWNIAIASFLSAYKCCIMLCKISLLSLRSILLYLAIYNRLQKLTLVTPRLINFESVFLVSNKFHSILIYFIYICHCPIFSYCVRIFTFHLFFSRWLLFSTTIRFLGALPFTL